MCARTVLSYLFGATFYLNARIVLWMANNCCQARRIEKNCSDRWNASWMKPPFHARKRVIKMSHKLFFFPAFRFTHSAYKKHPFLYLEVTDSLPNWSLWMHVQKDTDAVGVRRSSENCALTFCLWPLQCQFICRASVRFMREVVTYNFALRSSKISRANVAH